MKLEELARLAGVSKATASIIVNGRADRYGISQATREKVMALVEKYQYTSKDNHTEPSRQKITGLILPALNNIDMALFCHTLEKHLREGGRQLLLGCTENNSKIEQETIRKFKEHSVSSLVIFSGQNDDNFYENLSIRDMSIFLVPQSTKQWTEDACLNTVRKILSSITDNKHSDAVREKSLQRISLD